MRVASGALYLDRTVEISSGLDDIAGAWFQADQDLVTFGKNRGYQRSQGGAKIKDDVVCLGLERKGYLPKLVRVI